MKKFCLITVLSFLVLGMNAQDIFSPLSLFSDGESTTISKAKGDVDKATKLLSTANGEFQKYKNLVEHKKKGKQKKGEKKLVPAKQKLAFAGKHFKQGYGSLYKLYSEKIASLNYIFPEDAQKAEQLLTEAKSLFDAGSKDLIKYESYDKKKFQKSVKYKSELQDIKGGENKVKQANEKLYEALKLYEEQTNKQDAINEKDAKAWRTALAAGNISDFQKYIEDYPNGKYVSLAKKNIADLEEKIRIAEESQKNPQLIYHVQIMADDHAWTEQEIKSKIYNSSDEITETYVDGWYKYWIGEYASYAEAKKKVNKIKNRRKGVFVVGTLNDQPVDILQALEVENDK